MTSVRFPNPARAPLGRPGSPELAGGRRAALPVSKFSSAAGPWWAGWPIRVAGRIGRTSFSEAGCHPARKEAWRQKWSTPPMAANGQPCLDSERDVPAKWRPRLASEATPPEVGATCTATVAQGWPNHSSPALFGASVSFPNPGSFSSPTTSRIRRCPHRFTGVPVLLEPRQPSGSAAPSECRGWIQPIIPVPSRKEPIRVQLPAMPKPRSAGRAVSLQ